MNKKSNRSKLPSGIVRLRLEALEAREVPATLVGLTTVGSLVTFDSATPDVLIGAPVIITGLAGGETLVGIDHRPANGILYGVGSTNRIYTLNTSTGVATTVGSAGAFTLEGTSFGVDFNPLPDRIRVVGNTGQNLRLNPIDGTLSGTDTPLAYDPNDDTNRGFFGTVDPNDPLSAASVPANVVLVAAGYTKTLDQVTNSTVTTLYAIDATQDLLVRVGGPNGPPSPNGGQVVAVGELRDSGFNLIDFGNVVGLDIQSDTDAAFASNGATVYSVDLTTGTVTSLGLVGGGLVLSDLTIALPASGAGTLALAASTNAFPASRGPVAVTVTRTDGSTGPVTVDFATVDGTAVAGVDYLAASGTVSFANGESSRTIFLQVPGGTPTPGPAKTFTLNLSSPTGGAILGTTLSTVVTIPAVAAPLLPTRYYAVGSSLDARISVYNAFGGALAFSFRAFEGGFSGAARVAAGDVNGDGFDDVIVAAGAGGGPRVQIFDGRTLSNTNQTQLASFFAYDAGFTGGSSVSTGDINGDGFADVILGAGPGAGPHVRVLDGRSISTAAPVELASFFAFIPTFVGGVNVAGGNLNGDGFDDVIIGAAANGGPHVKVFDGRSLIAGTQTELASFFAFDPLFRGGVTVGSGDIDGDGRADVIVGAGPGAGPHVKVFNGRSLVSGTQTELASFFAFDQGFDGGINVAARDINRDGFADVIVGAGKGGQSHISQFDGKSLAGGRRNESASFFAFDSTFNGGVFVG